LSKLPPLFRIFVFVVFVHNLFSYKFCFLEDVIGALASHEELVGGASIGQVGLELPLWPPVVGPTPRPTTPGLGHDMGWCLCFSTCIVFIIIRLFLLIRLCICFSAASDTTITGWADSLHNVYTEIRGYYPFLFLLSSVVVLISYTILVARSLSP
jgi:hypothetical protein